MNPTFEIDDRWYFWDEDGELSAPHNTEQEAYIAFREYYRNR